MVQKYLDELVKIFGFLMLPDVHSENIQFKHFFTGAAGYYHKKIFCTYTPSGLAIKLPEDQKTKLLSSGMASRLRYFPKAPIKKEYVILNDKILENKETLNSLIEASLNYVLK